MQERNASVAQNDAELKKSVKSGMGLVVFAVVMTVVALGACGFAIYTKATENKRIDDAVSERCLVPASSVEGVPVAGDPSSANITNNTNCISDNTNAATANASDYVYVADWGVKIKKPENYFVWYRVEPDTGSATKGKLVLSASPSDAQTWPNYGDFDNGHGLLYIYRRDGNVTLWEAGGSTPNYLGSFGGYSYFYSGPQACSSHLQEYGGDACQREQDVFNTLKDTMGNLDNWSTF